MEVTTKSRAELKARFVKNSIPTETDFANLIDGLVNLQDDGVLKAPGNPLSIQADGENSGPQKVLNLYTSLKDANPAWSLSLNPRSDANNASSARPGFNLGDGSGASRLFIDRTSGNVGLGTITPGAKLEVNGSLTANGATALNGAVTIGSTQAPQPLTVSGSTTLNGNVGIGTPSPNAKLEVKGGQTILEQQAWQNAALVNLWANYEAGYNTTQYFKDSLGIVHLRGLIKGGIVSVNYNDAGLAFTLPVGYRPPYRQLHSVCTHPNAIGRVDITSDGRVIVLAGNNLWVSLDGIYFRVA